MSGKIFTLIRRYARLRGLSYNKCKQVYFSASLENQKLFRKEMKMAPHNDPILKIHDKFTGETKTFVPSEMKVKRPKIKPAKGFEIG